MFLRQQRHACIYNDPTNCTSHTMKPRLHNAKEISRRSQLCNAHKDVDVGRVAVNKSEYYNTNHFNISYLETLNPFHFLVSHLCNWLLGLFLWSLHHFVFWQWELKFSLCTTYSILFVIVTSKFLITFLNVHTEKKKRKKKKQKTTTTTTTTFIPCVCYVR